MYFVCLMHSSSDDIQIQMQNEIKSAKWVPVDHLEGLKFTAMGTNITNLVKSAVASKKLEG